MNEDSPLYNSQIIKIKLAYINKHYPGLDIDDALARSEMTRYEVEDPAHWFSQRQTDRLNEILESETGSSRIAREAGRFATSTEGVGLARQYVLGWLTPAILYKSAGKLMSNFSRGVSVTARRLGPNRIENVFTLKSGVNEKPYQCENRIGTLESMASLFTGNYATVEHPECHHRGDAHCSYIISWERSPSLLCKYIRNTSAAAGLLASILLGLYYPLHVCIGAAGVSLIVTFILSLIATMLENKELQHLVVSQRTAAQDHLDDLHVNYNNAIMVQEIGQAISDVMEPDKLLESVARTMAKRIDFDRGAILLANSKKTRLQFAAGFGFEPEEEILLRRTSFSLNRPNSRGVFVRAFKDKKPFLLDDLLKQKNKFSEKSQAIARQIRVNSLICVPIVYEKEALGLLAVDNINSKRILTKSDMSLLMGIASQTAVGIANAKAFQQLQESEERHRNILESLIDGYFEVDLDGNFLFFNSSVCRLLGYTKKELLGMNNRQYMDAQNTRKAYQTFARVLETDSPQQSMDWQVIRKDGSKCHVETLVTLIRDDNGQPVGFRGIARDITDRIHAEQENKSLQDQLLRAQKMEAIGMLAGGVAHDLNNVLSGLVTYPEMLLMDLADDSPMHKPITTIQKSGEKASAIVQDLLTLARRGVAISEAININLMVKEYVLSPEHNHLLARHPGVRVEVDLVPELGNILGSPVHLSKSLANIVSNAAEAMPGGGTIHISTYNQDLLKPIQGYNSVIKGSYAVLTVTDEGIGISDEDRGRIFEPFYTKKVMGRSGSGLGMAVVWGTVEDHKGYIEVNSTPGKGTTFCLYFPAALEAEILAREPVAREQYAGHGESILVVDDVLEQREIAVNILEKLGYQVAAVSSGREAVEHIREHAVDLVVLDMIMDTGMDGLETYQAILSVRSDQKAIIASGFSEDGTVKEAQRLGAGAYVKKPYSAESIGLAIRAELDTLRSDITENLPKAVDF